MIHYVSGDVLLSRAQAVAHGVAPKDPMNQGLARALHEKYPAMHKDYHHWCDQTHPKPGDVARAVVETTCSRGDKDMNSFSRRSLALAGVALLLAAATPSSGQLPPLDIVMQEKLDRAQRLLEAVVLQRHVTVEHYANELRLLSDASTWTSLESNEYLLHALDFQDAADELMAEARIGDSDGVAAAFSELVSGCVTCHTYLIGRDMARR